MGSLKILAHGTSQKAQNNSRGQLFEGLMAKILRLYGYSIDRIPRVNYAGMEIDIEGKHILTNIPLYAECKCYETEVTSPKLQAFYGKYMTRWLRDKRSHGIFIAIPGINSHAKGFYRENIEENAETTLMLYEEDKIIQAITGTEEVASQNAISKLIVQDIGIPGDWLLLYTEKGIYWIQYVIPKGGGIPSQIAIFSSKGFSVYDRATIDYLVSLYPELNDYEKIIINESRALQISVAQDLEEIVEVRGSSECFEYQFPASPEHFVGRQSVIQELESLVIKAANKEISSRGILFEANSGWGKSSVILSIVARLKELGHFAVAIDSRSASSSQFILRVVNYVLCKFGDFDGLIPGDDNTKGISGFEGAYKSILNIGQLLEQNRKILFIFLDQFENVFLLRDALKRIRDFLLKIGDSQTNVFLGFSWKTDLIGLTNEFPYRLRDAIVDSSKRIILNSFSEVETNALLDMLSCELNSSLRKDLRFFLSEFSQGFPWLLKKLCAHVKAQREAGVAQLDIAKSLLNIEELFRDDLRGLSAEEEEILRNIAKSAPINISELGEDFKPEIVQSLVNRRLLVKVGIKYDVYWDIFRDYLNSGRLPIQEHYILRAQVGSLMNATKILIEAGGSLKVSSFQEKAGLSSKNSFYNVARDMDLLGLAKVINGQVTLKLRLQTKTSDIEDSLRKHLQDRLQRNRLIWCLSKALRKEGTLSMNETSELLEKSCPYISATKKTWLTYARIFSGWMDAADLAVFDKSNRTLNRYNPQKEIRERSLLLSKKRGTGIPRIQYSPIERVAIKLVHAIHNDGKVDWSGLRRSTIQKSLATLEELDFITRKKQSIGVHSIMEEFVFYPDLRPKLFVQGALKMKAFSIFIELLNMHKDKGRTVLQLAKELNNKLDNHWKDSTSETNVKIMLNWARHTNLAPGLFAKALSKK